MGIKKENIECVQDQSVEAAWTAEPPSTAARGDDNV